MKSCPMKKNNTNPENEIARLQELVRKWRLDLAENQMLRMIATAENNRQNIQLCNSRRITLQAAITRTLNVIALQLSQNGENNTTE